MNKVELVVFDMAGTTIIDQKEVETCFVEACKRVELKVSNEKILSLQGYAKREVFQILWQENLKTDQSDIFFKVEESYLIFKEILERHYLSSPVFPTEGCLEIFSLLREQNIKIALTTGFYRKVANIILQKLGWLKGLNNQYLNVSGDSIIDLSVTSDEVVQGRPEPFMIKKAMQLLKVENPKTVINIGDTPSDLLSGIRAGCLKSFGVTNGTHSADQLTTFRNDGLLSSLRELPKIIENINQNQLQP